MTFATVGYGDIYAKTLVEELVADFMMIFGILLFGFIIGASRYASLLPTPFSHPQNAPALPTPSSAYLHHHAASSFGHRLLLVSLFPGALLTGCTRLEGGQSACYDMLAFAHGMSSAVSVSTPGQHAADLHLAG